MYPRIPFELVADPLGSTEHTLGTTVLDVSFLQTFNENLNLISRMLNYSILFDYNSLQNMSVLMGVSLYFV